MPDIKQDTAKSTEVFNKVFEEANKESETGQPVEYLDDITPLGLELTKTFAEYAGARQQVEQRWLTDLRQYRGEYDPDVKKKLHPKRSKAFLSLTRAKVKSVSSHMGDLLFPANGDKNWDITPSPVPELNPQIIESIQMQYQEQSGQPISPEKVKQLINTVANTRCDAMRQEMMDQLSELKYRNIIRNVIFNGNLYGTGILKGPLGKEEIVKRWLPYTNADGTEDWVITKITKLMPDCESVPVWDVYPDMTATRPEDMRGLFQRYVMTRNQVYALAKRSDFKGELIRKYLKTNKQGNAVTPSHEVELKALNNDNIGVPQAAQSGKYELIEYWGYLSADELAEQGVNISEDQLGMEVAANVWMLGPLVIKAVVAPIEGVHIPYHFYYYDKDDSSIWGSGIPFIMRDSQKLFNASVRAMLDNAAISAGPIIEANIDLLDPNENPKDLFPFRVFTREGTGMDAAAQAIRVNKLPSYTNQFMSMTNFFLQAADEITTIPRYMHGATQGIASGAGRTATGLSMLLGSANISLKDQIKNFDDGITRPFIKGLYFWNMDFNPKEIIKGDYGVVAKGSTSLIAREVKAESIVQFMNVTNNPTDIRYTKRANILREYSKILDLDEADLVKDANTVAIEDKQTAQQAAEERAFQRELAMIKAQSGGHVIPQGQAQQGTGQGQPPVPQDTTGIPPEGVSL